MNKPTGGPWRFRRGRVTLMGASRKALPGASLLSRRLFRNAPVLGTVLAWITGVVVEDLRRPESRIRALARRMLEKRKVPERTRVIVVPPTAIEGPGADDGRGLEKKKPGEE